jgi:hypothetical protein
MSTFPSTCCISRCPEPTTLPAGIEVAPAGLTCPSVSMCPPAPSSRRHGARACIDVMPAGLTCLPVSTCSRRHGGARLYRRGAGRVDVPASIDVPVSIDAALPYGSARNINVVRSYRARAACVRRRLTSETLRTRCRGRAAVRSNPSDHACHRDRKPVPEPARPEWS